ncbi:MAG: V0D/AC39 family V-type ATPase subunit [Pseudomonadota bacterium]
MRAAYLQTRVSLFQARLRAAGPVTGWVDLEADALTARMREHGLGALVGGDDDPRSLEARIVARLLEEARVALRVLAGAERAFLLYWIERFEISNVKSLIRAKLAGEPAAATARRLLDLGPFARLDAEALMRAEDVSELIRRLEQGVYAEIVRNARQAFEDSRDPFILDATLDRAYYDGLIRRAREFDPALSSGFGRLMGALVDRIALVWLLRYRFNYGLPPAQVHYLLPGPGERLAPARVRHLVALETPAAVLAALPDDWATLTAGATEVPDLAARLERAWLAQARRLLAARAPAFARALAYLILREQGLRDVRALLRGRRLGLPVADIRGALSA